MCLALPQKTPVSPALNLVFAPIVAKSLDREDKTFLHHYLKQKKQGEMLCFFVSG